MTSWLKTKMIHRTTIKLRLTVKSHLNFIFYLVTGLNCSKVIRDLKAMRQ